MCAHAEKESEWRVYILKHKGQCIPGYPGVCPGVPICGKSLAVNA